MFPHQLYHHHHGWREEHLHRIQKIQIKERSDCFRLERQEMKSPTGQRLLGGFTLKLVLILVMVELASTFAPSSHKCLVPSQVQVAQPRRCSKNGANHGSLKKHRIPAGFLVPSQVLKSHPDSIVTSSEVAEDTPVAPSFLTNRQKRRNRGKKPRSKNSTETGSYESTSTVGKAKATKQKNKQRGLTGDFPDIKWRAIPLEHMRHHPNFVPLPPAETIKTLECLEDVRNFRQESWQWDILHEGRCTTSQAVAALGFLEQKAGDFLGVPRSFQRVGGLGAYHRLRKPAIRTLREMNARLCVGDDSATDTDPNQNKSSEIWTKPKQIQSLSGKEKPYPFAAKYLPRITEEERKLRKQSAQGYSQKETFDMAVRMMWGNAQEATSILTALNYLWLQDNETELLEVGMCGAGLDLSTNQTITSNLLLGATPDGLIRHADGRIEALEVKNHCPFFLQGLGGWKTRRGGGKNADRDDKRFSIRRMNFDKAGVLPHYVPQLMMEMLCVGAECQSAVMVRQTATNGALIMRIHRDDEWIDEMMYWLNRFQADFVEKQIPPPNDFFWVGNDEARYKQFLQRTKDLESKVEVLKHVPNTDVQRVMGDLPPQSVADLFLD